jgi:carboxymethylenebutenolidase
MSTTNMNIIETEVAIPAADGTADGFLYTPKNDGRPPSAARWPGAIHLVDIGGIRESHRGMAKRLAGCGYVVLLPNVFYRVGKAPFFAWPMKMDDEKTMRRWG